MKQKRSLFVMVEEHILQDPDIQDLIADCGYEGFGVYIAVLTVLRNYEKTSYMIPEEKIKSLAKFLNVSEKKLKNYLEIFQKLNIFSVFEHDGKSFFYSRRRQKELFIQQELREKQIRSAKATNKKLGREKE